MISETPPPPGTPLGTPVQRLVLAELLDRALTKGVVIRGDAVISIAGVDLLYLGLKAVLASSETAVGLVGPNERDGDDLSLRSL